MYGCSNYMVLQPRIIYSSSTTMFKTIHFLHHQPSSLSSLSARVLLLFSCWSSSCFPSSMILSHMVPSRQSDTSVISGTEYIFLCTKPIIISFPIYQLQPRSTIKLLFHAFVCDAGRCHVTPEIMSHFWSFWVTAIRETAPVLMVVWGSNCIIVSDAQQGRKGICLVCGKVSLLLIFKTSVPFTKSA